MKVQVNDCFEPLTEFSVVPGVVRVLYLNERYDAVVLIQLTDPPRQPIGLGLEELRGSVIAGDTKLAKVVTPEFLLVLEDDLDEKKSGKGMKSGTSSHR